MAKDKGIKLGRMELNITLAALTNYKDWLFNSQDVKSWSLSERAATLADADQAITKLVEYKYEMGWAD